MSGFLLDTNVLSEFNRRGDPDPQVRRWLEAADPNSLCVSVVTFGEIRLGVELLPQGKRRVQLEQWLERDLYDWFAGRILPSHRFDSTTICQCVKGNTGVPFTPLFDKPLPVCNYS